MSADQRRSINASRATVLALVVLWLFWSFWGLLGVREVFRWVGAGPEFTAFVLADLEWIALITGFGVVHLMAAFSLRAGMGWATVLAGVLALLGLLVLGSAARSLIMMTVAAEGHFAIDTLSYWRFHGWQVVGIFGLLILADTVILVSVARSRWRSTNTEAA